MAAGKSQDMIQQLLMAEKQADELISQAKKNRLTKLRQAKEKAEEELKDFREKEERKFQNEMGGKASEDPSQALASATANEIQMVMADYQANKVRTVQYVVSKILDVPLGISDTQKQALRTGMA
mmetsp:Transcript_14908/g.30881  ORF Transcript_14908/g.30881 Transcript_14908/m.30881 type:complete len:124 (+) Transcript_14908:69-440(+)